MIQMQDEDYNPEDDLIIENVWFWKAVQYHFTSVLKQKHDGLRN